MLKFVASASVPLSAEPLFNIGPVAITNSMLFGVILGVIVIALFALALRGSALRPKNKFAFAIETLVEMLINAATENFGGDRKKALQHAPLYLTLFTFILISNLSGLVPGIGTVTATTAEGVSPLLRPFTTDLNGTLALAVLTIGLVQFYAVKELGIVNHLKHYFTDKPWNPMNLFMGFIEVLSEFIRVVTLSMRLFGVIYAGEVLVGVMGSLAGDFGWAATVPVYFLEIFFSAIQAYIFIMLATAYLGMATAHSDDHPPDNHSSEAALKTAAASK